MRYAVNICQTVVKQLLSYCKSECTDHSRLLEVTKLAVNASARVNYFVIVIESACIYTSHVIAIVIELSWRKVFVTDTLSNFNYSIIFPITSEHSHTPNQ